MPLEQPEQNRNETEQVMPEVFETASEQEVLIISLRLETPPFIDRLSELTDAEEFRKLALRDGGLL